MSYTVTDTHGCKVIQGPLPIDDLVALMQAWAKRAGDEPAPADEWVVDATLCGLLGATLVAGPRALTQAWRDELLRKSEE